MASERYDAIVLGLGGMGSAAAYHLARQGARVLGLDQYPPCHDQGSSHGRTRIIREAYYEAPEYVPLVRRATALWRELEEAAERPLLTVTGGLNLGRPETELVAGSLRSARAHGVPHEYLSAEALRARFPMLRVPDAAAAVYEPGAGLLDPEACVRAHLDLAARHGATLRHGERARSWSADGAGVRVETDERTYRAERLVIAAGPWSPAVLRDLDLPLAVWRILHVHFEPDHPTRFAPPACPFVLWEDAEGIYSAFPALPGQGVKFGRHDIGEPCTPETIRRSVAPEEVETLRARLNAYLPGAGGGVMWTLTCMYTMTPDHHFVVDRHPAHPQVAYACGFSGHGYKFASVIGEILADLALRGATRHPIGFLSASRFQPADRATTR